MPKAHNRTIRVPDRNAGARQSGTVVAWQIVAQLVDGARADRSWPVESLADVHHALRKGLPVVLTATLPSETNVDGYLTERPNRLQTVVLIGYSARRHAFRLVNSRGVAWGQAGRAWVTESLVSDVLSSARAVVPDAVKG
jgi:hypothetical protein